MSLMEVKKNTKEFIEENCVSNGKYCATDHKFRNDEVSGRSMLLENLYQCELGYGHQKGGNRFNFFEYIGYITD